jgi:hypothetical protein
MLVPPASAAQKPADALADDPWATVRPAGTTQPGDPDDAGRWRGWPDTDGTVPAAQAEPHSEPAPGPPALARGGCCAWPLPADATCAAVARGVFKEAAAVLGLSGELEFDGVTMASELAANTLHAHDNVEVDPAGAWPLAGAPELWIYLRPVAGRWELVCKVFDSLCGWQNGVTPVPGSAEPDAVSGRGLGIVAGLSGGRWGHHLTRSRLGGWKVPGKAVWFGQPVPASCVPAPLRHYRFAPGWTARALEGMLTERGLGGGLLRVQEPADEMSVLSVRCGLTVWCRHTGIWWRTPDGRSERRVPTDLEDTAEQLVCLCAEMDAGAECRPGGLDRVRLSVLPSVGPGIWGEGSGVRHIGPCRAR